MESTATRCQKWVLAKKMTGTATLSHFGLEEEDVATDLQDGEVLCEALYISVDPYMRVLHSKNPQFPEKSLVLANVGWRTLSRVSDMTSLRQLPVMGDLPVSHALGMLGLTGLTAYYGMTEVCKPKTGDVVVVTSAGGAVGSVAAQIAKAAGCKVIGICGSDDKCRWITEELGMDVAINYKTDNVSAKLQEEAPTGVNCLFDNVGGDLASAVICHMSLGGRAALCGSISLYSDDIHHPSQGLSIYRAIVAKQLTVQGFNVIHWFSSWDVAYRALYNLVQEGKLRSKELIYDGFDKLPEAFLKLFKGGNLGKIVVKIQD
ncbi:prostaglandin reductase 1-like isoform X2 [Mizuhopecten yessoensis]|uniref:prostaglandin reductase 1-like isoform X2 n=1 Tax=Mizuhopecten yessoensis TaxID=6573 RepID=UPI000B45B656|nr:prostaglandin reductase 1-like isoform X2 [Mizuhopecten yessoensis]